MNKLEENKLKGLCKTCFRRHICPKAQRYLDLSECAAYKVHGRFGKKRKNA